MRTEIKQRTEKLNQRVLTSVVANAPVLVSKESDKMTMEADQEYRETLNYLVAIREGQKINEY